MLSLEFTCVPHDALSIPTIADLCGHWTLWDSFWQMCKLCQWKLWEKQPIFRGELCLKQAVPSPSSFPAHEALRGFVLFIVLYALSEHILRVHREHLSAYFYCCICLPFSY